MKPRKLALILLLVFVLVTIATGAVFAQEPDVVPDVFEELDFRFIFLGVLAGVLYAFLGWSASGEDFEPTKLLRTIVIVTLIAFGLDLSGMTFDIYSAMLEPAMITVFLEKLLNTATKRKKD